MERGGSGKLSPITKPTPKANAHEKSSVFTVLTPDPACLDSYTTIKRQREKKAGINEKSVREEERSGRSLSFQYLSF